MRRTTLLIMVIIAASCQPKSSREKTGSLEQLKHTINLRLQKEKGTFAVAFKDLDNDDEILINSSEMFHAASTMKTPVMIEVFRQAAEGKFSMSDSITLKNEFKSIVDGSIYSLKAEDDSEQDLYKRVGSKRILSGLVYDMIIQSSNLATNMVIEIVDAKNVTQSMRELGAKDINVLRGVEDSKAFAKGMNNTTTAYDLMVIFEKITMAETVNEEASKAMIDILVDQRFNEIIPGKLPEGVKVAHKTGNISGVRHDSGIVFLPDGRKYVLVLLSKDLEDEPSAIEAMADVSEMIYKSVVD